MHEKCFLLISSKVLLMEYLQQSFPSDYIRHIQHDFIIIFETRHTGLIMASLNALVKLLPSSPFPLVSSLAFAASFLPPLYISIFLNFLGYARGKYLVLQPRFYRLPRVRQLARHSVWSHIFSRYT